MGKNKDIREAVEAELIFDPLVEAADITVVNMGGDVALNGTVPTYPQYVRAEVAARRVDGVRTVHNHLEVWLAEADYRDDAMLTTAANNALAAAVTVPGAVEATAKDGNVTLLGSVSNGYQRRAAEDATAALIGVRNVRNDIEVWNGADPTDVADRIQSALHRHALIVDDSDVVVDTDGRTVTLTGHVRTWAEHDAAIDAAWMVVGVSQVRDDVVITG